MLEKEKGCKRRKEDVRVEKKDLRVRGRC